MVEIKTLIISDRKDIQTLFKRVLKRYNYKTSFFSKIDHAYEICQQAFYNFIVFDLLSIGKSSYQLSEPLGHLRPNFWVGKRCLTTVTNKRISKRSIEQEVEQP